VCVACVSDRAETQESEEAAESVVTAVRSGKRGNRPVRVNALGGMALPSYDDKKHEFGTLRVRIIEAKGLLAADYGLMNKSSDPYCLVNAGHSVQVRTHTVSATLEPRWDTTLSFRLSRPDDVLHLEVWDEDTTSRDDAIGFLDLPLSQVPLSSSSAPLRGWVPLCRPEAQALPGEVVNLPAKGAGAVLLE
ncbi:MCTP2, partial [Symbiodinium sp. CCMP2456]